MTDPGLKFWPYKPRLTLAAIAAALVGLLLLVAILRALAKWPSPQSETVVLIGILLLSLLPDGLRVKWAESPVTAPEKPIVLDRV
jgi:hypothetical protein